DEDRINTDESGSATAPVLTHSLLYLSCLHPCFIRVHPWPFFSTPLPADGVHRPQGLDEARRVDLVPLPLGHDIAANHLRNLRVRGAAAEQALHVRLVDGEQAVAHLAVGGQADAVAAEAKRPRDRGDYSDATAPIYVAELHRRGAR